MQSASRHKLILVVVSKGLGSKIVAAAKVAGSHGGTIVRGRGTATQSIYESILGITYEPEKELVLVGVNAALAESILAVIAETGNLNKPGHGIGFVLDMLRLHGVAHLKAMDDLEEVCNMSVGKIKFHLIVTIVNRGYAIEVVEASKLAGAEGGTIINGRGSGIHETAKLFGIPIEPEKDIILTLVETAKTDEVLQAISEKVELEKPGKGIAFVLDVERTVGICHLEDCTK